MEHAEYISMDALEDQMWWYRALHIRLLDALKTTSGMVLDAGCGTGGFLTLLRRSRPDLRSVGLEPNAYAASRAAEKSGNPVAVGTVHSLPFDCGSFDAVVCADVLCHLSVKPTVAMLELHRVLRPGGLLVVNFPAHKWLHSYHDAHVFTRERTTASELRKMLRGGGIFGYRCQVLEQPAIAINDHSPKDESGFVYFRRIQIPAMARRRHVRGNRNRTPNAPQIASRRFGLGDRSGSDVVRWDDTVRRPVTTSGH